MKICKSTKTCKACNTEKDLACFRYRKNYRNNKYYYEPYCRVCEAEKSKIQGKKRYLEKGKEEFKAIYSDPKKKEDLLSKNKKYRIQQKEKLSKYREKRVEQDRKNRREWAKKKRVQDPYFKLRSIISSRINNTLKKVGKNKNNFSVMEFLPYTIQELKDHLEKQFEPWMSWENQGVYRKSIWDDNDSSTWRWQIDHIIPQADFQYNSMEDVSFQKCYALSNLRPLSAKQNVEDGVRRIRHKKI